MILRTTRYRHFKGGTYQLYGNVQPLPRDITFIFQGSLAATDADTLQEVKVYVARDAVYVEPYREDDEMVLYYSEEKENWWLREADEFHGEKTKEDGTTVKRFTRLDEKTYETEF